MGLGGSPVCIVVLAVLVLLSRHRSVRKLFGAPVRSEGTVAGLPCPRICPAYTPGQTGERRVRAASLVARRRTPDRHRARFRTLRHHDAVRFQFFAWLGVCCLKGFAAACFLLLPHDARCVRRRPRRSDPIRHVDPIRIAVSNPLGNKSEVSSALRIFLLLTALSLLPAATHLHDLVRAHRRGPVDGAPRHRPAGFAAHMVILSRASFAGIDAGSVDDSCD